MRDHKVFMMILAAGLLSGLQTPVFSDATGIDPRDIALDKTLGGMKEGSRILSPHGDIHAGGQRVHGTPGSHVGSAAETHHPAVSAGAPGFSPAAARAGSPLGGTEANHGVFVHGSSGSETGLAGSSQERAGANIGIEKEILPGGDTGVGGSSGGGQESTTGGGNEIGLVGSSQESTGANIGIEKEILPGGDTGVGGSSGGGQESTANGGSETGSAGGSQENAGANIGIETETLPGGDTGASSSSGVSQEPVAGGGSETSIIEVTADANLDTDNPSTSGDVAINPNAGGGLLDANTETTANTGSQEAPSDTSGGEHSIIETNAGADLSGGSPTVEAEVTIDPNANGGLIDAEATTSTDVIERELTSNVGLEVDVGKDTTTAETTAVATETGSTDASATNEATGGAEADVDGAGAGDDVECNAADGLPCPETTTPKL